VAGLEGCHRPQIYPTLVSPVHPIFLSWIRRHPSASFIFKLFLHWVVDLEADGSKRRAPRLATMDVINGTILYFVPDS
jgi:hypothetical protein